MTNKYDLINPGRPGRPIAYYEKGIRDKTQSSAVRVDFLASGVDTPRDATYYAYQADRTYPGDPFLPLSRVRVVMGEAGEAWRISYYGRLGRRGRLTDTSVKRADYEPMSISLPWWTTADQLTSTNPAHVNMEATPRHPAVAIATSWTRDIDIVHMMVPTVLTADPLGAVDQMMNCTNSNSISDFNQIVFAANTLLFKAPQVVHVKSASDYIEYLVTYHLFARAGEGWVRQKIGAGLVPALVDMAPRTTFVSVPYAG